ncbi:predicted protein [Plenodomus lingam JN3]|uniref:Predicted protein n=1 Tax=Leptosphaeria maculans (strain JN3 / isolate v23.1.3 / race Av1-4-5-6-7-8) TaxID=985895 RepID=E5A092_LEPMJ|nr:predicted protein [Plenodomus lingam JN3]CBX96952.1 predicted protein [Plenodomus lingam JN3]
MQFNVLAVLSSLLIVSSAAAIEQRQIDETNYCDRYNDLDIAVTFPHETLWGDYKLCCNYLGPNSQDTPGCCDTYEGVKSGAGWDRCIPIEEQKKPVWPPA